MTEAEKLILTEIREIRKEFRDGIKEVNGSIVRAHERIDDANEKIHDVDNKTVSSKAKSAAFVSMLTILWSGGIALLTAWIKSK